jgi:hypothetical protein
VYQKSYASFGLVENREEREEIREKREENDVWLKK